MVRARDVEEDHVGSNPEYPHSRFVKRDDLKMSWLVRTVSTNRPESGPYVVRDLQLRP